MNSLTGKIYSSIRGGFAAIIDINDGVPGYLFVQAENYGDFEDLIKEGLDLHFDQSMHHNSWNFISLEHNINNVFIGISGAKFDKTSHERIISASICEIRSEKNKNNFVSYCFGSIRFTLPVFTSEPVKPELLNTIFETFSKAIQVAPRTSDRADYLISVIFGPRRD